MQCRRATIDDADALAHLFADGMATYRSFAPEGWEAPTADREAAALATLLPDERVWCLAAVEDGTVLGQVMILPADLSRRPVDEPALAHLRNLFVDESRWGSGLARTLHDAALAAARERAFAQMRLFTPSRHGRARRFYEREGWSAVGDAFVDRDVGLELLEYRYAL